MHRADRHARYRILRRLGRGALTEVFEAELADAGSIRKVAIKHMLDADPGASRRFLDEAVSASRLHHANIVRVIAVGLLDGRPFQALEYVDGIDVDRLIARAGKLPVDVALAIATTLAHALDHAHSACDQCGLPLGIVHRDVKPSNVLLSWSGDVKLGDFGIAAAREERARQALDGRADVFALGLTLHALLTGRSSLELDPALPDDVRGILAVTLGNDRLSRPPAGELAGQLGAALASRFAGDRRTLLRDFFARVPRARDRDELLDIEVVQISDSRNALPRYETQR